MITMTRALFIIVTPAAAADVGRVLLLLSCLGALLLPVDLREEEEDVVLVEEEKSMAFAASIDTQQ